MKLTITMSNWNREWFLDKSIYLLSKQTLNQSNQQDDWELIVVDDGSTIKTDKIDKIINNYKNQNIIKNFHYIKKLKKRSKYGNCAYARNIGAKFGTGDYILFTDPEVMPMPDWAEQHLLANESNPENNYIGYCLHTRWNHVINDKCQGQFLGNAYTDYNWKDVTGTWKQMEERMSNIQKKYGLTDKQIKDEFYIYRATQAGHSLSRKLFYKLRGFEENFANEKLGLDKWGGEDTWFHICLGRAGSIMTFLDKAKAIHVYHSKDHSEYVQVVYANNYAKEHPYQIQSNLNREWGLIEENGFEIIF